MNAGMSHVMNKELPVEIDESVLFNAPSGNGNIYESVEV
jgi:hypothetical protein